MDLAIAVFAGLLAGLIAALTFIAPKTKSTIDDTVLAYAEKLEALVAPFLPSATPAIVVKPAVVAAPTPAK